MLDLTDEELKFVETLRTVKPRLRRAWWVQLAMLLIIALAMAEILKKSGDAEWEIPIILTLPLYALIWFRSFQSFLAHWKFGAVQTSVYVKLIDAVSAQSQGSAGQSSSSSDEWV